MTEPCPTAISAKIDLALGRLIKPHLRTATLTAQVAATTAGLFERLQYRKLTLQEALCTKVHAGIGRMVSLGMLCLESHRPGSVSLGARLVMLRVLVKLLHVRNLLLQRTVFLNQRRLASLRRQKPRLKFHKSLCGLTTRFDDVP